MSARLELFREQSWFFEGMMAEIEARGNLIGLSIQGIPIQVSSSHAKILSWIEEYFSDFKTSSLFGTKIHFDWQENHPYLQGEGSDEFHEFDDRHIEFGLHRDFFAKKLKTGDWKVLLGKEWEDGIHNFHRFLFSELLLDVDSLLIHASGGFYMDSGFVFLGPSGAGKSTTISNLVESEPKVTSLGDDVLIIEKNNSWDQVFVNSAPFGSGETKEPPVSEQIPLKGIYRLKQSDTNRSFSIEPARQCVELIGSAMGRAHRQTRNRQLHLASSILENLWRKNVNLKELELTCSADFWPVVMEDIL
ncbi:MAG: hypothetical protein CL678_18465 [Bdellovibrionaceae bacterium]|nr:hypothetical protein [Pseudobdellovibrionaceae bacterium]|tara:strand:- start:3803 stop:4714 length:912 start_codon:yes stop_codon:yes gene_type:complete